MGFGRPTWRSHDVVLGRGQAHALHFEGKLKHGGGGLKVYVYERCGMFFFVNFLQMSGYVCVGVGVVGKLFKDLLIDANSHTT